MAKVQIIDPRDMGRRQIDLTQPVFDADAVARADHAMRAMSPSFEQWLDADVEKLQTARVEAKHEDWSDASLETLMRAAHDLKGMGGSYGYPLVTRIAASLCRLIETDEGKKAARALWCLIDAHVDGIRVVARSRIATDATPLARELVVSLETRVAELGVAPR